MIVEPGNKSDAVKAFEGFYPSRVLVEGPAGEVFDPGKKLVKVSSVDELYKAARSEADRRINEANEAAETALSDGKKISADVIGPDYGTKMKQKEEVAYEAKMEADKRNQEQESKLNGQVEVLLVADETMLGAKAERDEALRVAKEKFEESKKPVEVGPEYGVRQRKQEDIGFAQYQADQKQANKVFEQKFKAIDEAAKDLGIEVTAEQLIQMGEIEKKRKAKNSSLTGAAEIRNDTVEEEIDTTPLDERVVPEMPEMLGSVEAEAEGEDEGKAGAESADLHEGEDLAEEKPVVELKPDEPIPTAGGPTSETPTPEPDMIPKLNLFELPKNKAINRLGGFLRNGVQNWWRGVMPVNWFAGEAAGIDTFRNKEKFDQWRKSFNGWNLAWYYGGVAAGATADFFKLIPGGSTVVRLALGVAVPFAMGHLETAAEAKAIRGMTAEQAMVELAEMREKKSKLDRVVANFAHGVAAGMVASTLISAGRDLLRDIFEKEARAVAPEVPTVSNIPKPIEGTPLGVEPVGVVEPELVFKAVEGTGFHNALGIEQLGLPHWDLASGTASPEDIVGYAIRNSANKFGLAGDQLSFKDLSPAAKALINAMRAAPDQATFLANGGQTLINSALRP